LRSLRSVGILKVRITDSGPEDQIAMMTHDLRIARVQRTLRWFEDDIPLLNQRVKELSPERQESAKKFAAAVIDQTRVELERLLREQPSDTNDPAETACEPAD
jgi:hypothetical protein